MDESANPPGSQPAVRLAQAHESALVCEVLADAFHDDPVMRWMIDAPEVFATLFRYEAEALYMRHRQIFLAADDRGAAMWLPPGVTTKPAWHWRYLQAVWALLRRGGLQSVARTNSWDEVFAGSHPDEPHYYLHSLGVARSGQGQGIGSALLAAGLEQCDRQAMPAYLESSNERNNILYQRFGFEIVNEINLPNGGPPVWTMWRPARTCND